MASLITLAGTVFTIKSKSPISPSSAPKLNAESPSAAAIARSPLCRAATVTRAPSAESRRDRIFPMRPQPVTRTRLPQSARSLSAIISSRAPSAVSAALPTAKSGLRMMSSTCSFPFMAAMQLASLNLPPQRICPFQRAPISSGILSVSEERGLFKSPPFSAGTGSITQSAP